MNYLMLYFLNPLTNLYFALYFQLLKKRKNHIKNNVSIPITTTKRLSNVIICNHSWHGYKPINYILFISLKLHVIVLDTPVQYTSYKWYCRWNFNLIYFCREKMFIYNSIFYGAIHIFEKKSVFFGILNLEINLSI